MKNNYTVVFTSLNGVLSHESLNYEGIDRSPELMRILDAPSSFRASSERSDQEIKMLQGYFQDMYGVFMKKLSHFIISASSEPDDTVKLQAMLQEMIKVKRMMER